MKAFGVLATLGALALAAPSARAQDTDYVPVADPVLRLDAVLHTQRDRAQTERFTSGAALAISGSLVTGGGLALALLVDDDGLRVEGGLLGGLGALYLLLGIVQLTTPTPAEDRWDQWDNLRRRGPFNGIEMARYEGELRLQAREEARAVAYSAALGFGLAAFGAAYAIAGVVAVDSTLQTVLIASGAAIGAVGLLTGIIALLVEPPSVKDLRMYLHGMAPRRDDVRIQVAPMVTPTAAGLFVAGTF